MAMVRRRSAGRAAAALGGGGLALATIPAIRYAGSAAKYYGHKVIEGLVNKAATGTVDYVTGSRKSYARRKAKPYQALNSNQNSNRRPNKGRKRRYKRKVPRIAKLTRQVKNLQRSAEADEGLLIFRRRTTGRCLAAVNTASYVTENVLSAQFCEAVLAQLRYYNPSVPGTLTTADGASGTFMKDFFFSKMYAKITLRNNYQVPCKVMIYSCKVKDDTSINPLTAFTNGLSDIGAPASDSPIVYPSDSPQFKDLWNCISTDKKILQPGEEMVVGYAAKPFQYDPSLYDSHALDYQTRYGSFSFFIRVEGIIAHDSIADQQGTAAAGVDYLIDRTVNVKYSAGADIEYLYVDNQSDSFTNGALVSSKPVADNIGYSVS